MDITIEVMLPRRGETSFTLPGNPKYNILDPIAVYELKTAATVGMPFTGYLHVINIPTPPGWGAITEEEMRRRLNGVLCRPEVELLADGSTNIKSRRLWDANVNSLPVPIKNDLLVNRQATITWGQCKALFKHRLRNVQLSEADFN